MRPRGFRKTKIWMISFLSRRKISLSLEENATHNKTKECARNPRYMRKNCSDLEIWEKKSEGSEFCRASLEVFVYQQGEREPGTQIAAEKLQLKEAPLFKYTKRWCCKQRLAPAKHLPRRCLGAARVGTRWKFSVGVRGPKSKWSSSEK